MYYDDMAMRVLARLEAIERRLGMDPGQPFMPPQGRGDREGDDRNGGRRAPGCYEDQDWGRRDRGDQPRGNVREVDVGCRFNEKRAVDQIVQLVTIRLEEMLRVLPQLIQVETRPSRKDSTPDAPPPAK